MPIGFFESSEKFCKSKNKVLRKKFNSIESDECNYECELVDCKGALELKKKEEDITYCNTNVSFV